MSDLFDDIFFYDDLPAERREAVRERLRERLRDDPDAARLLARWQAVRAAAEGGLAAAVPDRGLLVLHALEAHDASALTADERNRLAVARPALREARAAHPALDDVLQDLARAATDFDEAWAEHVERGPAPSRAAPSRTASSRSRAARPARPGRLRRWGWRVAAGTAVVAFAAVLLFLLNDEQRRLTLAVEAGAIRVVDLADGSSVRLVGPARLRYADPEAVAVFDRRVELEAGRAFFEVQPASIRFVVETPSAQTTVLGTRFGVTAAADETEVVLAEGEVALAPRGTPDRAVVLQPGQASRVRRGALPTAPEAVDLAVRLRWSGLFIFRDTPLVEAVEELAAHYETEVRVAASLRREEVTGTFDREQSLEEVLRVLAAALGAELRHEGEAFVVAPSAGG